MAMQELGGTELRELIDNERRYVLVDFWSPWCAPCRTLRPHLNKLAEDRREAWCFAAVNTEAHPTVGEEFSVRSLPTLILMHGGRELFRFDQGVALSSLVEKIEEISAA